MKNDNNESRNNQTGNSKAQPTLANAARLSMGRNGSLPSRGPRLTRERLSAIIQMTLDLVEEDLEDTELFHSRLNYRGRRPFDGQ